MISRRRLLQALVLGGTGPGLAWAQKTRLRRIGFLGNASPGAFANHIAGLRTGLREHGYDEGKNLQIEFRWSQGNVARLPEFARELVRVPVEVLVTQGTPGTRAAMDATKTLPIVMAAVGDVVTTGLVQNLARPGGNVTGLTFFAVELGAKRIELVKQALPHIRRVAVIINPDNPIQHGPIRDGYGRAAASLDLALEGFDVRTAAEFADAISQMRKRDVDAIIFTEEPLQLINAPMLTTLAASHRLPSIGPLEFLPAGCPLAFGVHFPDLYRRAAGFVARILAGAKPGDLPVERATRFEFVVNANTAKALGLSLAPAALQRADRVID